MKDKEKLSYFSKDPLSNISKEDHDIFFKAIAHKRVKLVIFRTREWSPIVRFINSKGMDKKQLVKLEVRV